MGEQRGCSGRSRRRFLRTAGATALSSGAGCLGAGATYAAGSGGGRSTTVAVLAAGSLQHALENGLKPAVDVPVRVETHGSRTVARMIAEGQRDPDIVSVSDTALFEDPLSPPWYSVFASNAVVLAYNPSTDGGQRIAEMGADGWYRPLIAGTASLGRTDPERDPLGYRALFTLELASRYYDDAANLADRILGREQIYPETGLMGRFETGSIDAALAYRNMAAERGYEYIELPDRINLGNPAYVDDWYATVSYELPSGQIVRGDLIGYGSTIRDMSEAALSVFDVHTTGQYLDDSGFLLRGQFPVFEGDVPATVKRATAGSERRSARRSASRLTDTVSEITLLL